MEKRYIKLFTEIARTVSVLAESVMDYNRQKNDEEALKTSTIMRDDYNKLHDMLCASDFNPEQLTKKEYAKLLVGAIIITNQIEERLKKDQIALDSYKALLIPKLEQIVNDTAVEEIQSKAEELFNITEEEEK